MRTRSFGLLLLSLTLSCAWAQGQPPSAQPVAPPPQASPPPEQLEPAVDTTATTPAAPVAEPAAAATSARSDTEPAKNDDASGAAAARPAAATTARPGAARAAAVPPRTPTAKGPDRVELETTDITGNRELPKVLYIVPWKRSDLGDLVGKPPNSLLDEVLQPIDRDVFLRENRYYDALKPDAAGHNPGVVQGSSDKP